MYNIHTTVDNTNASTHTHILYTLQMDENTPNVQLTTVDNTNAAASALGIIVSLTYSACPDAYSIVHTMQDMLNTVLHT